MTNSDKQEILFFLNVLQYVMMDDEKSLHGVCTLCEAICRKRHWRICSKEERSDGKFESGA